jgi:Lar family restriction alleviation protein
MGNEELKPCPFCGEKAYIIHEESDGLWEIGCHNQKCKLIVYTRDIYDKKEAIAAWNKRVKEAADD